MLIFKYSIWILTVVLNGDIYFLVYCVFFVSLGARLLAVKIHNRLSRTLMPGVEYMILSACLIVQNLAAFAAPISINRLLKSVIIFCGSDFLIIIVTVIWKPVVQIPLSSLGSGSFVSSLGQSSEIYAPSGIFLFLQGH